MSLLPIKVYRPDKEIPLPYNADPEGNAGWDLYVTETTVIPAGEIRKVPVNIRLALERKQFGWVAPRSGMSSDGILVVPGIVDNNYRGQVKAITHNSTKENVVVEKGMRIAQLIVLNFEVPQWVEVEDPEELGTTIRMDKGFGESGKF